MSHRNALARTDAELIARSATAPEACEAAFDRHFDALRHYAVARVGLPDGEDVAGQTVQGFADGCEGPSGRGPVVPGYVGC